jgi:hypothetical protein
MVWMPSRATGQEGTTVGDSKRRKKSGLRRAAKVRSRRSRLAEEEAARERHARVVAERAGDPRFIQQETFPGGRTIRWDSETPVGAKLGEGFEEQISAFRAKFGRDPRPDDPLFFEPHANEPMPLSKNTWDSTLDDLIANADQHGVDPAYLKAWRELGYLLIEENKHLFSATEVQTFFEAVEKYHDDDDQDADDDADIEFDDITYLLASRLEAVVEVTLRQQSQQPARLFVADLAEADTATADIENHDVEKDDQSVVPIAFAVLVSWSTGARREIGGVGLADTVLAWISTHLGEPAATLARHAARILSSADALEPTVKQLADELSPDVILAMIWLAAGLVAEYGSGDATWLRHYKISSEQTG